MRVEGAWEPIDGTGWTVPGAPNGFIDAISEKGDMVFFC